MRLAPGPPSGTVAQGQGPAPHQPSPHISVSEAMDTALRQSTRARPRPLPPAGPARTTESQHPAPNRAGGGQHQSAQPSMLEAAIASLPPHIQSAVAPPPVPPGADPICGPYYNKAVPPDILSVKVHKADEFRSDVMLTNPVVRLHVLNPHTGEHLKTIPASSAHVGGLDTRLDPNTQAQIVRYAGRPVTVTVANNGTTPTPAVQDYLPPVQTTPYNLVRRRSPAACAVWGETLLVDEALQRLVSEDALLIFEILQLPVTFHRFDKHPDQFSTGTHPVAWAFLRVAKNDGSSAGPDHGPPAAHHAPANPAAPRLSVVMGDLKLQLYQYPPETSGVLGVGAAGAGCRQREERHRGKPVRAYMAWKALMSGTGPGSVLGPPVDKYPAALHITLGAVPRPPPAVVKTDPFRKQRGVLPAGYGSGFEEGSVPFVQFMLQTFANAGGGLAGTGLLGTHSPLLSLESSPWYRSRGDPCRLPNRAWRRLPTGAGGACCAAFSPDGAFVAVATGEGLRSSAFHILIYSTLTCQEVASLQGAHQGWVHSLQWSGDSKALVSASADGTAKIWEMGLFQSASKTIRPRTLRHPCHVYTASFHPKQSTLPILATAGANGALYVWHRYSGQPITALAPTTLPASPLLPSPPGASDEPLGQLSGCVNVLTFDTLGSRLWAGDGNGTIQEFSVETAAVSAAVARVLAGVPPMGERVVGDVAGGMVGGGGAAAGPPGESLMASGSWAAATVSRYAPHAPPPPPPGSNMPWPPTSGHHPHIHAHGGLDQPAALASIAQAPPLPPSVLWQWVPDLHTRHSPPPPPPPLYPASPDGLSQAVVHQQRAVSGGGAALPANVDGSRFVFPHPHNPLHPHPHPQHAPPPLQHGPSHAGAVHGVQQPVGHTPAPAAHAHVPQAPQQQQQQAVQAAPVPSAAGPTAAAPAAGQQQQPAAAASAVTYKGGRDAPGAPSTGAATNPALTGPPVPPHGGAHATPTHPNSGGMGQGGTMWTGPVPTGGAAGRSKAIGEATEPQLWAQQPQLRPQPAAWHGAPVYAPMQPPPPPPQLVNHVPPPYPTNPHGDVYHAPGHHASYSVHATPGGFPAGPVPIAPNHEPYPAPPLQQQQYQRPMPNHHQLQAPPPPAPQGMAPPPPPAYNQGYAHGGQMHPAGAGSVWYGQQKMPAAPPPPPPPPPEVPLLRPMRSCAAFAGEPVASLYLHPSGRKLVVLTRCSRLATVDTRAFNVCRDVGRVKCRDALVKAACSPDGAYILAGGENGVVRAYDGQAAVGADVAHTPLPHASLGTPAGGCGASLPVHCVAWNPHLHMVAVCGWGSWSPLLLAVYDPAYSLVELGTEQIMSNGHEQVLSAPVKKYELPDRLTPALVEGLLASVREDAHKRGVLTSPARAQTAPPPPGGPGAGEPIRLVPHPSPTGAYGRPVPHPDVDQLVILKPHEAPPEVLRLQQRREEKAEEDARVAQRIPLNTQPTGSTGSPAPHTPATPAAAAAAASPAAAAAGSPATAAADRSGSPPPPLPSYTPRDLDSKTGQDGRGTAALQASAAADPSPAATAGAAASLTSYKPSLAAAATAASGASQGEAKLRGLSGMGEVGFSAAVPPQQHFPQPIMAGPGATVVVGPGATVHVQEGAKVVEVTDPLKGHTPNVSQRPYDMRLSQPLAQVAESKAAAGATAAGVTAAAAADAGSPVRPAAGATAAAAVAPAIAASHGKSDGTPAAAHTAVKTQDAAQTPPKAPVVVDSPASKDKPAAAGRTGGAVSPTVASPAHAAAPGGTPTATAISKAADSPKSPVGTSPVSAPSAAASPPVSSSKVEGDKGSSPAVVATQLGSGTGSPSAATHSSATVPAPNAAATTPAKDPKPAATDGPKAGSSPAQQPAGSPVTSVGGYGTPVAPSSSGGAAGVKSAGASAAPAVKRGDDDF